MARPPPSADRPLLPGFLRVLVPPDVDSQRRLRLALMRVLIAANLALGTWYLVWRVGHTMNWNAWPLALALLFAEVYSGIDGWLFGVAMWKLKVRGEPPPAPLGATVDIFITCYNEPVEMVQRTAEAAKAIRYPCRTYVLDDGSSPAMRAMAERIGVGYITRGENWKSKDRHAKAGNLINALARTDGEFMLILDADQVPAPTILDRTLGFFTDPRVALVQTPQWFWNTPAGNPFGTDAELFYGPIQQAKDGWNSAFFCGSNAVLRREALYNLGVVHYVREMERRVRLGLRDADGLLAKAQQSKDTPPRIRVTLAQLRRAVATARKSLKKGDRLQDVTWRFQRSVEELSRALVQADLDEIARELQDLPGLSGQDLPAEMLRTPQHALSKLSGREVSPLMAIAVVRDLVATLDLDRTNEAEPVLPMATISVTEDMATAMRLHALGWKSVFHAEVLAYGLAPEDLRTALQQRLRWAQGTIQVMLRENPLWCRGLSPGQRLMYFATMWSYLSGFSAVCYIAAPICYLMFGVLPIRSVSDQFLWHLVPYLLVNQLFFALVGYGIDTVRGQQYSLALFPLWIRAVVTTLDNVYRNKKLGFVVTPKVREGGRFFGLVRVQLFAMGLLALAVVVGLGRLALGAGDVLPILINVVWACYSIWMLSAVLDAATWQPEPEAPSFATLYPDLAAQLPPEQPANTAASAC